MSKGNELYPCFNANVGHANGHGSCRTLVEIGGMICGWECSQKSVDLILKEDGEECTCGAFPDWRTCVCGDEE